MQIGSRFPVRWVLFAGLAGGLAEIVWVALYASTAPLDASRVAHEVTASFVAMPMGTVSVWLGVGLHMLLALAVAAGFAALVSLPVARRHAPALTFTLGAATLAAIWAMNFTLVLPVVNPDFVALMPHSVTLASKLLFGLSMAAVLTTSAFPVRAANPSSDSRV